MTSNVNFPNPSSNDQIKFDSTNIRGLKSNLNSVQFHLQANKPHILALGETQVFDDNDISQYHVNGYSFLSAFYPHRGTAVYIRNDVCSSRLTQYEGLNIAEFSVIWLKITICSHDIYFCLLYRSPSLADDITIQKLEELSDTIENIYSLSPNAEIIFSGDFNIHNVQWLQFSSHTDAVGRYVECFADLNLLEQLVDRPTRIPDLHSQNSHLLDLFLTTHPSKYTVSVNTPLGNSDHCLVSATFQSASLMQSHPLIAKRNVWHYGRADWEGLNSFYRNIDWSYCFSNGDVDIATHRVTFLLQLGMNLFIPCSERKVTNKTESWFTSDCKVASANKNSAFSSYKSNPSPENHQIYKHARNLCNSVLKNAKRQHEQMIKNKILKADKGSRSFWSFVSSVSKNFIKSSVPPLVDLNGSPIIESRAKANLFASIFAKNSTLDDSNFTPTPIPAVNHEMPPIFFRYRVVLHILKTLNTNKSTGPDGIPAILLKNCAISLANPLRKLFYLSFIYGQYPKSWKLTNVQPVPKKGNRSNPENYRPIAICSILAKTMEKIINYKLMNYLEVYGLLSDRQYGFRARRSTGDMKLCITELWNRSIHMFGESQAVALDISKAFDRVSHKALVLKLGSFGINPLVVHWIDNFLKERSIQVVVDGVASNEFQINAGVPQGSCLSPTLFLIFINDLLSITRNPVHCFADDSTLHHSYSFSNKPSRLTVDNYRRQMNSTLNEDLSRILEWGKINLVAFNASKTQSCLFSHKRLRDSFELRMSGAEITQTPVLRALGTDIDSKLLWYNQIIDASKNAARRLGFLRRCKRYFNSADLAVIYKAYIRPLLEYDSHIWAGAPPTSLAFVDRIQKRAMRLIDDESISNGIDSLQHRRNVGAITLFYRYYYGRCSVEISNLMPPPSSNRRATRLAASTHAFSVDTNFIRTVKFSNSFISRTSRMWNQLPGHLFPSSYDLHKFKSNIHSFLKSSPFPN